MRTITITIYGQVQKMIIYMVYAKNIGITHCDDMVVFDLLLAFHQLKVKSASAVLQNSFKKVEIITRD